MTHDIENLKYPIGKYRVPDPITSDMISQWLQTLEDFPGQLRTMTASLTDEQLDTPYRPHGWTVRQLLVHIGDSHLNSYVRFKWALTEDKPVIKTYSQEGWVSLADVKTLSAAESVGFISAIHERWVKLLKSMTEDHWNRSFVHPETRREVGLKQNLALYDWHSRHHYAHIRNLVDREGW